MLAKVDVPWIHKEKASTSYEGALYAALECIGSGDPALAQRLHDDKGLPPFSARLADGVLSIGALNRDVFLALNRSKLAHRAEMTNACTFDDILAWAAERPLTLRLEFVTPTSFGRHGETHVLPELPQVFGSLVRRWRMVGGPEVPQLFDPARVSDGPIVMSLNLRTQKVQLGRYPVYGTTGYMLLRLPPETAVWFNALARFGEYSGVGQRTTQGFGQVRVDPTRGGENGRNGHH